MLNINQVFLSGNVVADAEVYSGLRKGDFVAVAGELRSRSYEDKKGEKRYVTEVVAQNLTYGLKQK